jgi:hypothetical protein
MTLYFSTGSDISSGRNLLTTTREKKMATYECEICGMSVNATCGKCDAPLENGSITLEDGTVVQVSKCPNGHGMIKSPLCCGQDMTCKA